MLHSLPVLILVLVGIAAQADAAVPDGPASGPDRAQMNGAFAGAPGPPSYGDLDPVLMIILAVAAVAFQFRRRYRMSRRTWQRISATTDTRVPEPLTPTPRSAPARMRWQQTH